MKEIAFKKENFLKRFCYEFICKNILKTLDFIYDMRNKFCIYNEAEKIVKRKVEESLEKVKKFEQLKRVAPFILETVKEKNELSEIVRSSNESFIVLKKYLTELYIADLTGDDIQKDKVFGWLKDNNFIEIKGISNGQ